MRSRRGSSRHGKSLHEKRILCIVTGGIAAYKAAFLVRLLKRRGALIRVVMSEAAIEFVTPLTFEVLSGNPVSWDLFAPRDEPGVEHVELATWAERIIVAPATADFISKSAHGAADDLASTILAAARCPVYFVPSMNAGMWENPAVGRNIAVLESDGRRFVEPGSGELACGETGPGRMAEPEEIARALENSFAPGDLDGVRVLVTAGRTEEEIDRVRYISNRSSGRMGFAIADAARRMGARVSVIHGPVDVPAPEADSVKRVRTAAEMKRAVTRAFPESDLLIMAAAVADFTPAGKNPGKIKREGKGIEIELRPTPDILASVAGKKKKSQIVVGFALEEKGGESNAREKIRKKGCDYMVLNVMSETTGFIVPTNRVTLFKGNRKVLETGLVSKIEAASMILDKISSDTRLKRKSK
jgi:phosphopantothenoylcysteine decarboxylase/phosphopantothenate--cysteine ligase